MGYRKRSIIKKDTGTIQKQRMSYPAEGITSNKPKQKSRNTTKRHNKLTDDHVVIASQFL